MDWRWDFTFEVVLPRMWEAAGVTAYATVVSFLLALVLGLVLMLLKTSPSKWVSWPAGELIEFIRATPLLVQIFFLFFIVVAIVVVSTMTIVVDRCRRRRVSRTHRALGRCNVCG